MDQRNVLTRACSITPICLLILVAGGLYLNSLGNLFTNWDDSMIYANTQVKSLDWGNIIQIFTLQKASTYQPIRVLSYAVDYHFWGLNPVGYHVTNIFFYIMTCVMVYFTLFHLSRRLRGNAFSDSHERVALFGGLLFAVHPVHVEAVTWLAARKEVLQGFFFFTAFYLYLKGEEKGTQSKVIYLGLVLLAILLAILSKPSAIVFPAIILVYEIAKRNKGWIEFIRSHWLFLALLILVSIIFFSILIKVMLEAGGIKHYRGGSFSNNLLVSFYVFLYNIKLLFFTINYSAVYTIPINWPILNGKTFVIIGITVILFALSFWSLKRTKVFFFSFLFFFVSVLPYLNIVAISMLLADRYVFIALFAYALILGVLFDRLYTYRHERFSEGFFKVLSIAIFLFLLACYSFMTIRQNTIWQNSYTLWTDAVQKHPESNTANALMGVVYMELGMDRDAVKYLEKAVQVLPYDYQSHNNLGIVYCRLDEPEKALKSYATAIRLRPDDDTIKINLSYFFQKQENYTKSEEILKSLIERKPSDGKLCYRLGLLYKDAGQFEAAISQMMRAIELAPDIINSYIELGNIYATRMKDKEKAEYYYSKGIESAPKAKTRIQDLRWMVQDLQR